MPTLSTRPSIGVPDSATRRSQSVAEATSATTTGAWPPASVTSAAVARAAPASRSTHTTSAPPGAPPPPAPAGGRPQGDRAAVAERRVGFVARLGAGADHDDPAAGEVD